MKTLIAALAAVTAVTAAAAPAIASAAPHDRREAHDRDYGQGYGHHRR